MGCLVHPIFLLRERNDTMKIHLIRHGQVNHNLYGIYSNVDEDLNETGITQALTLKEKVNNIDYDVIYSSPLIRAKHTAEIINTKQKQIIIDNRLTERNPGNLSGQPLKVTNREEYWKYYSKIHYGTSERIVPFFDKVFDFINSLKSTSHDSALIVGHSGVSKAFYAYFNGIPEDGKLLDKGLKNCEIKEYYL